MGFIDPAFRTIKPGQVTFAIWRVENFEIKVLPQTRYGSFHEGDSYIVYSAAPMPGKQPVNRGNSTKLEHHIHFWLGKTTTSDEAATAAIKTVELDDILNGTAVQHRELQGFESDKFKSYFKNGLRILKGGVASGLHHVTDSFTPRLFKIKGKRRPTVTEQADISWSHFNSGDVFIVETKERIFVWVGKNSNKMEKYQAGKVAAQMKTERSPRTVIFIEEDREDNLGRDDLIAFQEHLLLGERVIRPAEDDSADAQAEKTMTGGIKLYRCTDEGGSAKTTFIKEGPLMQADLSSMDSYIIVNNRNRVWVWIGKKASDEERSNGMKTADEFLKNLGSEKACVTRVVDGAEPVEFQMLFADWRDLNVITGYNPQSPVIKTVNMDFDAAKLHEVPHLAADSQLVDNGNGRTQVWRLHDRELEPVPEDLFGVFFSGDCYLILYTYVVKGREMHLLYYWLGAHSSIDERGGIAWHAVKKDDELNGAAIQVRVVQSKEDPQFLLIFKGKMIIFNGGYASSFDGAKGKNSGIPTKFLLQVRGGDEHSTQSVEVKFSASSLNTNDVFVLFNEKKMYVWYGKGSTGDERERAKEIANQWSPTREHQALFEGSETEEFWSILGGKEPYANDERLAKSDLSFPARLFHCSNASGYFKAEEIVDFNQYDLAPNDVMILDIGTAVFIWVGQGANKTERTEAPKLVEEYLKTDPRGRDLECPVITVQQGVEPPNFTGFFGAWDPDLWESSLYKEMSSDVPFESKIIRNESMTESYRRPENVTCYPFDELVNKRAEQLPEDVDVLHREVHLTDEEFEEVFKMNRDEYEALPTWKQNNLKKEVGLF